MYIYNMRLLKQEDNRYKLNLDKIVFIYRNLHKHCFSIRQNSLVKAHTDKVRVLFPKFKVNEAGRQRVLEEGRKNVHAGVMGALLDDRWSLKGLTPTKIEYNPYLYDSFVKSSDKSPVRSAVVAVLDMTEGLIGYDVK